MVLFEIRAMDPDIYRQQTRRIAVTLIVIFAAAAMLLAGSYVLVFGEIGGDNFQLNLMGVFSGLLFTILLVRFKLWSLPWMAPAVYGWRLKRSLMRVTNVMHHVTRELEAGNPAAMSLLRFYHLGLTQMHRLDGNSSGLGQMAFEIEAHRLRMEEAGLDAQQDRLESVWLEAVKQA